MNAESVTPIRKTPVENLNVKEIPAFITELRMDLGGGRQIHVQKPFGVDENMQDALGNVLKAADYHRARYDIEELENELHKMELMAGDLNNSLERVRDNPDLQKMAEEEQNVIAKHNASGRRGDVRFADQFIQRRAALQKQHDQNIKNAEFQIRKHGIQMDRLRRELEKKRKLIAEG